MAGRSVHARQPGHGQNVTLHDRITEIIASEGPIPVSTYMALCLHDPAAGYYATQPGLGRDFITAPELSQVFGELIGLWAVQAWHAMGRPSPFLLAEFGPGRATLMLDALRAARLDPGFMAAMQLCLVEASPALRSLQGERLKPHNPLQVADWRELPEGPAICIGNEFLDCLPARQFVRIGDAWVERVVGLSGDGRLQFGLAEERRGQPLASLPDTQDELDLQPALDEIVSFFAARTDPYRALFLDYGPASNPPGDTLRAFRESEQVDPLDGPGTADLTVDVDFARLARLAAARGIGVSGPQTQGAFLARLGIQQRLDALVAANPAEAEITFRSVSRLVDPEQMGERFKAVCLSSPGLPPPAAF